MYKCHTFNLYDASYFHCSVPSLSTQHVYINLLCKSGVWWCTVHCREYYCLLHSAHIDVHISQIFYRHQFITREIYLISFNIVAYFIVLELMYLLEWNIFYKTDMLQLHYGIFLCFTELHGMPVFMASIILLVQGFLTSFWWHFYLMRNTPCITIDNLI